MNICVLTSRFPFPEIGGDSLRINNVSKYLKSQGHRIILVSFYGEKEPDLMSAELLYDRIVMIKHNAVESAVYSLRALLSGKPIQTGYYYSPRFLKAFRRVVAEEAIDVFVPHAMRMTEYLVELHLESKTIVEQTDAMSKTYTLAQNGKGSFVKRLIYNFERKLTPSYEEFMLRRFPRVVFVSPADVKYLQDKYPDTNSAICLTNGFDIPEKIVQNYDDNKICIMGNMRTLQNQDAALFFVDQVFPLILQKRPNAKFYIVGAEPSKQIQDLASDNIIVTGFVDSVEDVLGDACLCVAPVRIAAGIQNKVLVSMGCGVPVVLSELISKPIPQLVNGKNCFIEDDPAKMADICLQLMKNNELRNSIASAGRQMIIENYTWDSTLEGYL